MPLDVDKTSESQSLYWSAISHITPKLPDKGNKGDKSTQKVKKSKFISSVERAALKEELTRQGLPVELADMSEDEAIVFLKDEVDEAGDALSKIPSAENLSRYRSAVGNFTRYVEKNSYEVVLQRRWGRNRRGASLSPVTCIKVINQRLDKLASDLLYNHLDKLAILASVGKINGLLIDLLAG